MKITRRLLACLIAPLFFACSLASAAQNCSSHASDTEQKSRCEKLQAEEDARQKEYAEFDKNYPAYLANKDAQRRADEIQRRADEWDEQLKQLKTSSDKDFCIRYGDAIRHIEPKVSTAEQTNDAQLLALLKKQAKLRKLSFEEANIRKERLRIGMSKCMLYASWGRPFVENTTTGRWGQHIQHVYRASNTFVYTENGRVTGWQD